MYPWEQECPITHKPGDGSHLLDGYPCLGYFPDDKKASAIKALVEADMAIEFSNSIKEGRTHAAWIAIRRAALLQLRESGVEF